MKLEASFLELKIHLGDSSSLIIAKRILLNLDLKEKIVSFIKDYEHAIPSLGQGYTFVYLNALSNRGANNFCPTENNPKCYILILFKH